jgi:hypothetical protein
MQADSWLSSNKQVAARARWAMNVRSGRWFAKIVHPNKMENVLAGTRLAFGSTSMRFSMISRRISLKLLVTSRKRPNNIS